MKTVLVAGAGGRIGRAISLLASRSWNVVLYDTNVKNETQVFSELAENRRYLAKHFPQFVVDKASSKIPWFSCLQGQLSRASASFYHIDAVISAVPHIANKEISSYAIQRNLHYLDMTEDVEDTRALRMRLEKNPLPSACVIPGNGIAPGFVSILGKECLRQTMQSSKRALQCENLTLRVGALPQYALRAPLWYSSTWSSQGMVNQCIHPCVVVRDHKLVTIPPLNEYNRLFIEGIEMEEFSTSGGLGTLGESLSNEVSNIQYRTLRYPGHWNVLKFLLEDLQLKHHPEELVKILSRSLPSPTGTPQDVVYVLVTIQARDTETGQLHEHSLYRKITPSKVGQVNLSAIETATAASTIAMMDLVFQNKVKRSPSGFCKVEDVSYQDFIQTNTARCHL